MAKGRGFLGRVKAQLQWQSRVAHHREHNIEGRAAGQLEFGQERRSAAVLLFGVPFSRPPRRSPGRDPRPSFLAARLGILLLCYFFDLANAKGPRDPAGPSAVD
jgi:hypothetical protein